MVRVQSRSRPGVYYEVTPTYCTCPKWKYQKIPPALRSCPHLEGLEKKHLPLKKGPIPPFFLIANHPPKHLDCIHFYRWSRKLDGIRVCIDGFKHVTTRNGMRIPIMKAMGHTSGVRLDAELIYRTDDTTSYSKVTAHLHDPTQLVLRPFAVFGRTFQNSHAYLRTYVHNYIEQYEFPPEAHTNPLKWMTKLLTTMKNYEGIIVRHLNQDVIPGGRCAKACFKYKVS